MTADGFHARRIGQALRDQYGTVERDDFETLISDALSEKLASYIDDWEEEYVKTGGVPLKHYYVSNNGKTINLTRRYKWMLDLLEMHMGYYSGVIYEMRDEGEDETGSASSSHVQ